MLFLGHSTQVKNICVYIIRHMCVRGHKLESLPGAKCMVENIKETKKIGLCEGIKPFMANSNVKTNCGVSLKLHW